MKFICFKFLTLDAKDGGDSHPRASRDAHCSHCFNWLWICMWIESWLWRWVCSLTSSFLLIYIMFMCIISTDKTHMLIILYISTLTQKKGEVLTWHTDKLSTFPVIFSFRLCCCSMSEVSQLIYDSYALRLSWECIPFPEICYIFLSQLWVWLEISRLNSFVHILLFNYSG